MITWRMKQQRYGGPSRLLMSGAVPVGDVSYNGARSRNDDENNTYVWTLNLPGKTRAGHAATQEAAQQACMDAFLDWLRAAKLEHEQVMS